MLSVAAGAIWIGLNDKDNEAIWKWVNGERARVSTAILWIDTQPDNHENAEDCAGILATNEHGFGTNDFPCGSSYIALCEKKYVAS